MFSHFQQIVRVLVLKTVLRTFFAICLLLHGTNWCKVRTFRTNTLLATSFLVPVLKRATKMALKAICTFSKLKGFWPWTFLPTCTWLHGTVVMKSNTACFFLFSCSRGQRKWCYRVFLFFCKLDFFCNLYETDWSEVHYI